MDSREGAKGRGRRGERKRKEADAREQGRKRPQSGRKESAEVRLPRLLSREEGFRVLGFRV